MSGLNMAEFAKTLGLEAETYRQYERGNRQPNLAVLQRLHALHAVDLNFLVAGARPQSANTSATEPEPARTNTHRTGTR